MSGCLSSTLFLYTPFLHPRHMPTLMAVCKLMKEGAAPAWREYQAWTAPMDAEVLRRSHALDDLVTRILQMRPHILRRRADVVRRLRTLNRLLRDGVVCGNRECRVPLVRGTERCDACFYWVCEACRAFRPPGTHALPCANCGRAALHGCRDCALLIPRDRERCYDCRCEHARRSAHAIAPHASPATC